MADEAPQEAQVEEGGKKKIPLWVIILVASQVVLVAVAFVVFKMLSSGGEEHPPADEEATHEEAAAPAKAEEGGGGHGAAKGAPEKLKDGKALSGPKFDMEGFIVNLIDDGRGPRYLKVEMKFELEDENVRAEIENRISQIRDELLILLSSKRQTDIETTDGKRILKDEIFTRVNKILVTGRIKRVYFTDFVIQ